MRQTSSLRPPILTCFIVLSLFFIFNCGAQNFIGTWTDYQETGGYGGLLHICQRGRQLFGAYSEAGLLIGTISGNTASGVWIEGGDSSVSCTNGKFFIALANDGDYFLGWWSCAEKETIRYDWAEQRLSILPPNSTQCAELFEIDGGFSIEGLWREENNDGIRSVCIDDDEYESSYEYFNQIIQETVEGHDTGKLRNTRYSVGSGYSNEKRKQGLSLLFLLADGRLGQFWWFALKGQKLNPDDLDDDDLHQYRQYTLESTQPDRCRSNVRYLNNGYYVDDIDKSSSSTILPKRLLILFLVVLQTGWLIYF